MFSAYPMGGSFGIDDYFIESDGDEADDEFDQITNSADVEEHPSQFHLSVQPKVRSHSSPHSNEKLNFSKLILVAGTRITSL